MATNTSIFEKTQGTILKISEKEVTNYTHIVNIAAAYMVDNDAIKDPQAISGGTNSSITTAMQASISAIGDWIDGSCATSEIAFQGGQKTDVDVTSLCSTTQESFNGLASPAEITLTRNWAQDDLMLRQLEDADDKDEARAYCVIFPSGNGFVFMAEVRQNSWSVATAGKVSASYTLRLRGKPVRLHVNSTT